MIEEPTGDVGQYLGIGMRSLRQGSAGRDRLVVPHDHIAPLHRMSAAALRPEMLKALEMIQTEAAEVAGGA